MTEHDSGVFKLVADYLSSEHGVPIGNIGLGYDLALDGGLDSLDAVELASYLEEKLGIPNLDLDEAITGTAGHSNAPIKERAVTVGSIVGYVESVQSRTAGE